MMGELLKAEGGRNDTRLRILETARKLFSLYGFDGTSVRDIARESRVNLSAINYHFRSKESLYWALMLEMHGNTDQQLKVLSEQSNDLEEYSLRVFDFFMADLEFIRSIMKLMLTAMPLSDEAREVAQHLGQEFGPPGSAYFGEFIQKAVPFPLSTAGMEWGVSVIFNHITQTVMSFSSPFCSLVQERKAQLLPDSHRQGLCFLIRSTLEYMQRQPQFFHKDSCH